MLLKQMLQKFLLTKISESTPWILYLNFPIAVMMCEQFGLLVEMVYQNNVSV